MIKRRASGTQCDLRRTSIRDSGQPSADSVEDLAQEAPASPCLVGEVGLVGLGGPGLLRLRLQDLGGVVVGGPLGRAGQDEGVTAKLCRAGSGGQEAARGQGEGRCRQPGMLTMIFDLSIWPTSRSVAHASWGCPGASVQPGGLFIHRNSPGSRNAAHGLAF
jgi:hypothetical protein